MTTDLTAFRKKNVKFSILSFFFFFFSQTYKSPRKEELRKEAEILAFISQMFKALLDEQVITAKTNKMKYYVKKTLNKLRYSTIFQANHVMIHYKKT